VATDCRLVARFLAGRLEVVDATFFGERFVPAFLRITFFGEGFVAAFLRVTFFFAMSRHRCSCAT
jgi:hypothetical protein